MAESNICWNGWVLTEWSLFVRVGSCEYYEKGGDVIELQTHKPIIIIIWITSAKYFIAKIVDIAAGKLGLLIFIIIKILNESSKKFCTHIFFLADTILYERKLC